MVWMYSKACAWLLWPGVGECWKRNGFRNDRSLLIYIYISTCLIVLSFCCVTSKTIHMVCIVFDSQLFVDNAIVVIKIIGFHFSCCIHALSYYRLYIYAVACNRRNVVRTRQWRNLSVVVIFYWWVFAYFFVSSVTKELGHSGQSTIILAFIEIFIAR